MTAVELDIFDPENKEVTLQSGFKIEIVPIKTRQLFRLIRILTQGISASAGDVNLAELFQSEAGEDQESVDAEQASRLVGFLVYSIPEAEDETVDFLESMAKPVGLIETQKLSKADSKFNEDLWAEYSIQMFNPDIDDLVSMLEIIIVNELPHLKSLGKRIQRTIALMSKTGQDLSGSKDSPKSTPKELSEASQKTSTSSRKSTGGKTKTSSTSASEDSSK